LAGIDDAHYYRVDDIEKVVSEISHDGFSILLSEESGQVRTKRRVRLQTRSVALGRLRIASLDHIGKALVVAEGS